MFKKKILPIVMFCGLLLGMAYFPYIPMKLFKLDYSNFNMTLKIIYNLLCDIGLMGIVFLLYKEKIIKDGKKYFKNFAKNFEQGFKYYFIGVLVMVISNLVITLFFTNAIAGNEEAVRDLIDLAPVDMIFSVSIYAPFIEEIIFRLSIKDAVLCHGNNKITHFIYILISGFIFSAMHVLGQTTSYADYLYIIPYMSLGIAFAALYTKTDNIFSSIMMHSLHNTATIVLYLMAGGIV